MKTFHNNIINILNNINIGTSDHQSNIYKFRRNVFAINFYFYYYYSVVVDFNLIFFFFCGRFFFWS